MKSVFRILVVISILLLIGGFFITMFYGYKETMLFLINGIGESNRTDQILGLVSETKFLILQILFLVLAALMFVMLLVLNTIVIFIKDSYTFFKQNVKVLIQELRTTEVKWLLVFPLASSIFFAVVMPVSYDEAWTYLQFTSKSPLSSLCYYPAPNNHVLHSLITNITRYIPFLPILFCLRISSIIVSFFTWLLCFSFFKRYYSENISLVIMGIASMLFMPIYYSYMSRGYGLVLFFFVLALYASYNIIFKGDKAKYWFVFGLSNVLGFFTMPSYLYVCIILNVLILWNNKFQLKNQFISNAFTLFLVLILYTPIIIVNGVSALTSNTFVLPISRHELIERLPLFLSTTLSEITGVHFILICILLLVSFFMLVKSKMKFELGVFVIFIVSPFLLLIIHSVIPFPRTFNYYSIVIVFLILIPFGKSIQNIKYLLVIIVCVQFALFLNFYFNIKKYETFNISYHEINKKIVGNNSYFFSTVLFETNFLFENEIHGYKMSKAEFNFPQVNVDVDTMSGFDYYIIDKQYDFTKTSSPTYFDATTNVYKK